MKHKILILVSLAASLQVRGQRTMKTDNLLKGLIETKYEVLKSNKHIKDGSYQYTFGGFLLTEGQYQKGKKVGLWKFHSPDGKLSFIGTYYNDSKVGRWIYAYQGAEVADIFYAGEGHIQKRYSLYPNGDTAFTLQRYTAGTDTLISHKSYFSSGELKYTGTGINGLFQDTVFYRNGQMEMITRYEKSNDRKVLLYLDSTGQSLQVDSSLLKKINRYGYEATVDIMPSFPGGEKVLSAFLSRAIQYPERERLNRVQGRVLISFVIDQEGYVGDVKVKQSVNKDLDDQAMETIKEMPRWNPGMQNGLPVKVQYALPIEFHL